MTRLIFLLVALSALVLPSAAVAAAAPIEGPWLYEGGEVVVSAGDTPGSFVGTVRRPTKFIDCAHPRGERMWEVSGSGDSYQGTHRWFTQPDCSQQDDGAATWRIRESGDRLLLVFCTAPPAAGSASPNNPATRCSTLERPRPGVVDPDDPAAPVSAPPSAPGDSQRPSPPVACAGAACLAGPPAVRRDGCVARGSFTHRFAFTIKRRERRRLRVRAVRFTLDWKPNGVDRRSPWVAKVDGSKLRAGSHLLIADVRLAVRGSRRTVVKRLSYRFQGCA